MKKREVPRERRGKDLEKKEKITWKRRREGPREKIENRPNLEEEERRS